MSYKKINIHTHTHIVYGCTVFAATTPRHVQCRTDIHTHFEHNGGTLENQTPHTVLAHIHEQHPGEARGKDNMLKNSIDRHTSLLYMLELNYCYCGQWSLL